MLRLPPALIIFLIIFAFYSAAYAQPLSMEQAVNAAIEKYPTIEAQRAALASFQAGARVLKDNRLPNVRLHDQIDIGTANGLSGSYFSMGMIVPTSGGRRPENRMDLTSGNIALATADWEVYNFGRFKAEDQLVIADIAIGQAGVEREAFLLRQAVVGTYLDVLWRGRILQIESHNLARADTVSKIINNLVSNGIRPGLDSSLASVELSRARLNYYEIDEGLRRAFLQLAMLTGRKVSQLVIDTTFHEQALLEPGLDLQVAAGHPLLRYQASMLSRQQTEVGVIRKTAMPRVSLMTAAWARGTSLDLDNNYGPLGPGFGYSRTNFLVGLAATVNLVDFKRIKSRMQVQQWKIKEADVKLGFERMKLENTLASSDSVMSIMRQALRELPTAIRSAESAYQQRLSLYNNGIENILGLTDAMQLLTKVEKQAVDIQRRAVELRLQRAYATSDFDEFFSFFRRP
ncbi:Outer membrane protein TolC [Dyadobacter soli]|uniref:Outer membrane protein TolC n=1 Tax=Dyadobacter soli TaxID=659014 RepID=A0A1G7M8X8_9BACT|nr:TolC family protein [Dyadobacter soli]SDF58185.1 Outer membrane protein TolC [Dyadobacter soli]